MVKAILSKLERLFKAANWEEIEITMKSTGLKIRLAPCFDDNTGPDPRDIAHCAFILSTGAQDAIWYSGKPEEVARMLANHDKVHAEWKRQADSLQKYYEDTNHATLDEDCYGIYSDWYKEVYGHRPWGGEPDDKRR